MDEYRNCVQVAKTKPGVRVDGVDAPIRCDRFGAALVQQAVGAKVHTMSDEGSYFVLKNATTGTGIASTAAVTAYSATAPFLVVYNSSTTERLYLDYLKLQVTAAGTAGSALWYDMVLDAGNRYSSGGTACTKINPNMDSTATGSITSYAGAVTATSASASVRKVAGGAIRLVIPVLGDQYLFVFGGSAHDGNGLALAGTAITSFVSAAPPIVVGPLCSFLLHLWLPSQSAASSYEYELGLWQR